MKFSLFANRETDEAIILSISGAIAVSILPFVFVRLMQGDIALGIVNACAVIVTSCFFIHVWLTRKTIVARWGISLLSMFVMLSTVYLKGSQQVMWVYPAMTIIFYLLSGYIAAWICVVFMTAIIIMIAPEVSNIFMLKFVISALTTFLFCFAFSARMRVQASFLSKLAVTDGLTGAGNRRAMEEKLEDTIARLERYPSLKCSLILIDIDYFKKINDKHGHAVGDQVLVQFAKIVQKRIRASDGVYRYGGEEFLILLENTSVLEAMKLASDLREDIEKSDWHIDNLRVTASAGVAQRIPKENSSTWIARADAALYKAKASGRNCCLTSDADTVELMRQARSTATQ